MWTMKRAALGLCALLGCSYHDGPNAIGGVQVVVLRDDLPVDNAVVIFHDSNGRMLSTAHTDGNGTVSGDISTLGMVTVIDPGLQERFTTVTRVSIGARLEVPLRAVSNPGPPAGTLTITPPALLPPQAVKFEVHTSCGREYTTRFPATIQLYERCDDEIPVLITARAESAHFEDPGRPLAYSAGATLGASYSPAPWSTACKQVAIASDLELAIELWPRLRGHTLRYVDLDYCQLDPPPGGFTVHPALDFGDGGVIYASAFVGSSRTTTMFGDMPSPPTMLWLTREHDLLIGDSELVRNSGSDIAWSTSPSLAVADAVIADVRWMRTHRERVHWRFVLPPDATTIVVPELPADVQDSQALDAAVTDGITLRYIEASWFDTYDRVHGELPLLLEPQRHELPAGGRIRDHVESLQPGAEL